MTIHTAEQFAEALWTATTRTLAAGSAGTPKGATEEYARVIWEFEARALTIANSESSASSASSSSSFSSLSSASSFSSASSASSASSSLSSHSSASSASSLSSESSSSDSSDSTESTSSSSSSESGEIAIPRPIILSVTTYDGGWYGGIIVRYKAFAIEADDLEPGADVRLFVDGDDTGLGALQEDGTILFMRVVLPLGGTNLSIRQELGDEVSERSPEFNVRVNSAENTGVAIPVPTIHENRRSVADWPVNVTITSDVPGTIFYCVDGTGFSQPTIKYKGPFRMYQTGVVKAKVKFNRLKSFTPIESAVVKRTIRIVR